MKAETDSIVATQAAVARFFRRDRRTIADWIGKGMPRQADGRFSLPDIAAWREEERAKASTVVVQDVDPLLSGGPSPALEAYRSERAKLARLDRLEREGTLVQREIVREQMMMVGAGIRGIGDALKPWPEAFELFQERLSDIERTVMEHFGRTESEPDERAD